MDFALSSVFFSASSVLMSGWGAPDELTSAARRQNGASSTPANRPANTPANSSEAKRRVEKAFVIGPFLIGVAPHLGSYLLCPRLLKSKWWVSSSQCTPLHYCRGSVNSPVERG